MVLKMGVKPGEALTPQIVLALMIADEVYAEFDLDLVVTSIADGKHMNQSLHYVGRAVDLRSYNVPSTSLQKLVDRLREALGSQYDVVLESDHIHVEFDPR